MSALNNLILNGLSSLLNHLTRSPDEAEVQNIHRMIDELAGSTSSVGSMLGSNELSAAEMSSPQQTQTQTHNRTEKTPAIYGVREDNSAVSSPTLGTVSLQPTSQSANDTNTNCTSSNVNSSPKNRRRKRDRSFISTIKSTTVPSEGQKRYDQ